MWRILLLHDVIYVPGSSIVYFLLKHYEILDTFISSLDFILGNIIIGHGLLSLNSLNNIFH